MASNYPPGVTGSEPEIIGGDDPTEGVFTDLSSTGEDVMTDLERSLALRAINTERNLLARLYGWIEVDGGGGPERVRPPHFFAGVTFDDDGTFEGQVAALNRLEARLNGCECCFNNADDFEHYHSPVCNPDFQEIEIIPDATNVFARHSMLNPNAF